MPRTAAQRAGAEAEERALKHLRRKGRHHCLARNFRTPGGEVDLVTLEGEVLVFVEVRARTRSEYGLPEETVGPRKRQRLQRAARAYLASNPDQGRRRCRFDVVAVDGQGLRWIRDAFQADTGQGT